MPVEVMRTPKRLTVLSQSVMVPRAGDLTALSAMSVSVECCGIAVALKM
jgi:hypothetical protein